MLSYQHIYHAGSITDVQKHFILSQLFSFFANQSKINYVETHAGRGIYNLQSKESQKTKEFIYGIEQVYKILKDIVNIKKTTYFNILENIEKDYGKSYYPGSPMFANYLLKKEHKKYFFELHKGEFSFLEKTFNKSQNVYIKNSDGFNFLNIVKISKTEPLIVFIDPSYELKEDYTKVFDLAKKIIVLHPNAIIVIWYPILVNNLYKNLQFNLNSLNSYMVAGLKNKNTLGIIPKEKGYFNFHNIIMFKDLLKLKLPPNNRMLGTGLFVYNCPLEIENLLKQINLIIF
jgi:23S rRNA (adenine2030-N6)-methyltransferase